MLCESAERLPEGHDTEGRWGDGMRAAKMASLLWLEPFFVVRIEFLELTPDNRLRHPRFVGLRSDKDARDVMREEPGLLPLQLHSGASRDYRAVVFTRRSVLQTAR
jgi:hypothetical protein